MLNFGSNKQPASAPNASTQIRKVLMDFFHDGKTAFVNEDDQRDILETVEDILKAEGGEAKQLSKDKLFPAIYRALLTRGVAGDVIWAVLKELTSSKVLVVSDKEKKMLVELMQTLQNEVFPKLKNDTMRSLLMMTLLNYDNVTHEMEKISIRQKFPNATPGFVDLYLQYKLAGNAGYVKMLDGMRFEINATGALDLCIDRLKLAVGIAEVCCNITKPALEKMDIPAIYDKKLGFLKDRDALFGAIPGSISEEKVTNFRTIFEMQDSKTSDFWTNSLSKGIQYSYNIDGIEDAQDNPLKSYGPLLSNPQHDKRFSSVRYFRTLK